jgi:hypothetical protein
VITFSPASGAPAECSTAKDTETVHFADQKGNSTLQYFQYAYTTGTPTPPTVTASRVTLAFVGPTPVGGQCGTYQLKVQAYDQNNALIIAAATYTYPITISVAGADNSALITSTAPTTASSCTAPSNGASSLSVVKSTDTVYVYTNGLPANGPTMITATAFGMTPSNSASLTFGAAPTRTTISSLTLAFLGATPTSGTCGTYQLKVQAYDQNSAAITTPATYTYPVTISIAGANNTAVVTSTAPGAQSPCSAPPAAASTLSVFKSTDPVYVFVNGSQVNLATTITATAFGAPAITLKF